MTGGCSVIKKNQILVSFLGIYLSVSGKENRQLLNLWNKRATFIFIKLTSYLTPCSHFISALWVCLESTGWHSTVSCGVVFNDLDDNGMSPCVIFCHSIFHPPITITASEKGTHERAGFHKNGTGMSTIRSTLYNSLGWWVAWIIHRFQSAFTRWTWLNSYKYLKLCLLQYSTTHLLSWINF